MNVFSKLKLFHIHKWRYVKEGWNPLFIGSASSDNTNTYSDSVFMSNYARYWDECRHIMSGFSPVITLKKLG